MTYKSTAIFLALGIFLAGALAGCKTPPPPEPAPAPPPPVRREAPVTREARPAPPPPPEIPARPITRGILELIGKSAYETRDLQYFISSGITLEHGKGMQIDIEIYQGGEGIIEEINAQEKIIIPKDTGGVLIPDTGPTIPGGPRALKICFDDVDEHTLTFRENPADSRFYLAFREDRQYGEFTEYGSETYKVDFKGEIPYLYVRLDEKTDDRPRTRELRGRYVASRENAPEAAYEAPVEAPPPAAVRETTVPGRTPQPARTPASAAPAPAPQTPANVSPAAVQDTDDEDELDLDALLEL
ncbi:hypothetical protein [Treponema primitia]|uniref:hypothetical protein n=1 Tax=Treponema primitia TaxID=88058 RepID=UPI0009D9323B|nr:hypothetical protein [Treponema primitia]